MCECVCVCVRVCVWMDEHISVFRQQIPMQHISHLNGAQAHTNPPLTPLTHAVGLILAFITVLVPIAFLGVVGRMLQKGLRPPDQQHRVGGWGEVV